MSRHRFIEMAALHRLDCIHDLYKAEAEFGSGTKRCSCNGKLLDSGKSGLKRIKVICRFPLIDHEILIHLNGVNGNMNFQLDNSNAGEPQNKGCFRK